MARTCTLRQPSPTDDRADSPIESIEEDLTAHTKRRMSNITATSVSSLPESALASDSEGPGAFYAARPRPTFRVGSLRRSPLPDRLSARPQRSPRRPRSRDDVTETPPLVLLHVTVLPPGLPWRRDVLDALLSEELKNRFGVLRVQTAGLVRQRGILIAHPQDEFEVLVERVLEALGLLPERIGLDGQFRPRAPSTVVEGEEEGPRPCEQCQMMHGREEGAGWQVKVYAANGLMRAGAWEAAWSEMERVDVEILPCIPDEVRRCLDDAQMMAEDVDEHGETDLGNHGIVIHTTAPQEPRMTQPQDKQAQSHTSPQPKHGLPLLQAPPRKPRGDTHDSLPQVYRPKEIPLNVLLRNYVYLLLRDRRNVAIAFLVLTMLASTWFGMLRPTHGVSFEELDRSNPRHVGETPPSRGVVHDSWAIAGRGDGENAPAAAAAAAAAAAVAAPLADVPPNIVAVRPTVTAQGPAGAVRGPQKHGCEDVATPSGLDSYGDRCGRVAGVSPNPGFVLGRVRNESPV